MSSSRDGAKQRVDPGRVSTIFASGGVDGAGADPAARRAGLCDPLDFSSASAIAAT